MRANWIKEREAELYDARVERAREAFRYFLISALRASRGGEGLVEGLRLGHGCERPAY